MLRIEKIIYSLIIAIIPGFFTTGIIIINFIFLGLILFSLGIFVIETYPIPLEIKLLLRQWDTAILIIFTIEYLIRFCFAPSKKQFFFNIYSLIDLVSILPLFLGYFDVRFIKVFRCFRFLRFFRFLEFNVSVFQISREDIVIYAKILLTLFSIIFVYSGLIYQVEHPLNRKIFQTFGDALYFSIVTMTTVGFGDVIPITHLGRLLTVMMILTGVALIPWQIGDLIKQLIKSSNKKQKICPSCTLALHEYDANYCKICGFKLINRTEISLNQ